MPAAFPLALHLGACHDAAVFMDLAAQCKAKNIPVLAVVPEPVHSKAVAVAVGLAGGGIPTYLDSELFSWLPENMLNGMLRPLSALSQ